MKSLVQLIQEVATVGQTLICTGSGRVAIISGAEARSAEAVEGNTFTVSKVGPHWIEGILHLGSGMGFQHNPGLSGKNVSGLHSGKGIVYGIQVNQVDSDDNDFWATWKKQ